MAIGILPPEEIDIKNKKTADNCKRLLDVVNGALLN